MNVALYEKIWMWAAGALIAVFLVTLVAGLAGSSLQPPSHVETIDPTRVDEDPRFAQPGVTVTGKGATVVAIASMYSFVPDGVRLPANRPITFRITSRDVTHGYQIVGTNGNTMVVPGYVSQFTMTFAKPGEYLVVCNEYCGIGHHNMHGTLVVEEAAP